VVLEVRAGQNPFQSGRRSPKPSFSGVWDGLRINEHKKAEQRATLAGKVTKMTNRAYPYMKADVRHFRKILRMPVKSVGMLRRFRLQRDAFSESFCGNVCRRCLRFTHCVGPIGKDYPVLPVRRKDSMTQQYTPTLAQACFGNATSEYALPEFAEAFFHHVWRDIERVYWNIHQKKFDWYGTTDPDIPGITVRPYYWGDCNCGAEYPIHEKDCAVLTEMAEWTSRRLNYSVDPDSHEINFRKLSAFEEKNPVPACSCGAEQSWTPRDRHEPTCGTMLPNFVACGAEIRWYKHPGRGMSTNVDWTEKRWRLWLDETLRIIRDHESKVLPF